MEDHIKKTVLSNGLTIVTEHIPSVKSVTAGIWVKSGARHETKQQAGVTHFLEHMLLKVLKIVRLLRLPIHGVGRRLP